MKTLYLREYDVVHFRDLESGAGSALCVSTVGPRTRSESQVTCIECLQLLEQHQKDLEDLSIIPKDDRLPDPIICTCHEVVGECDTARTCEKCEWTVHAECPCKCGEAASLDDPK